MLSKIRAALSGKPGDFANRRNYNSKIDQRCQQKKRSLTYASRARSQTQSSRSNVHRKKYEFDAQPAQFQRIHADDNQHACGRSQKQRIVNMRDPFKHFAESLLWIALQPEKAIRKQHTRYYYRGYMRIFEDRIERQGITASFIFCLTSLRLLQVQANIRGDSQGASRDTW